MTDPKTILLNDTSSFNHYGCHLVIEQIRQHCKRYGLNLWHTVKLGEDWRAERHRERFAESNIVLVNGEGSFHHDRKSALILAQSAAFCRERNIPCVLINSVYQDNGNEMAHLVRQFDLVFARESRSQTELRKEGINSEVAPDMTLSHADLSQGARSGVIVTDSSSDNATMQLQQFCTRTKGVEFAGLFRPISNAQALRMLVARVIGKRAPKLWQFEWRRYVKSQRTPLNAVPLQSVDELFRRISSTSLIVTGRFHMGAWLCCPHPVHCTGGEHP